MKWMLALAGLLAVSQLMGCQTIGRATGNLIYEKEINALKDKPADVAYQSLENPSWAKGLLYETMLGVDPKRYNETVTAAADRNLMVNDTPGRAFDEMIVELSQKISSTIPSLPAIKESKNLKALVVGKFKNETGVQGGKISMVVETVADNLLKNQAVTNEFAIISVDASSQNEIIIRVAGSNYEQAFASPDGSNFKDIRIKKYHPQDIYVLTGSVFKLPDYDGGVPRTTISTKVRIEHPRTGETIATEEFNRKYIYHPVRRSWMSDAENEGLRAKMQEAEQKK
mgnify:CR=1 FL=1